jgi:hypothetical protein
MEDWILRVDAKAEATAKMQHLFNMVGQDKKVQESPNNDENAISCLLQQQVHALDQLQPPPYSMEDGMCFHFNDHPNSSSSCSSSSCSSSSSTPSLSSSFAFKAKFDDELLIPKLAAYLMKHHGRALIGPQGPPGPHGPRGEQGIVGGDDLDERVDKLEDDVTDLQQIVASLQRQAS